jgi:hypothetical protein
MSDGLAKWWSTTEWWSQVCDRAEDDEERLDAAAIWLYPSGWRDTVLGSQGKYDESENMQREQACYHS